MIRYHQTLIQKAWVKSCVTLGKSFDVSELSTIIFKMELIITLAAIYLALAGPGVVLGNSNPVLTLCEVVTIETNTVERSHWDIVKSRHPMLLRNAPGSVNYLSGILRQPRSLHHNAQLLSFIS